LYFYSQYYNIAKPIVVAGGSCSNTLKGIACFGEKSAYIGKIGRDAAGQYYKQSLSKRGVIPLMTESFGRTGQVLCLITSDGQRTMRTCLGASVEMNENDLLPQDFKGVKLVHVEGYSIYNEPLLMQTLKLAKQNQALVSYDMGSFEVVRSFKTKIMEILRDYVDIVFCNKEEAHMLVNGTPEDCVDYLSTLCRVAIVMMGKDGCWVRSGAEKYRCPTKPIANPVDTTGAGDLFASGFLYGYMQGYSLEQCARLGALAGSEVIQVVGAEIPMERYGRIKQDVNSIKLMTNHHNQISDNIFGSSPSMSGSFMHKIKTSV
jgi:sugar/nucleoside kinase (ribokinase family)